MLTKRVPATAILALILFTANIHAQNPTPTQSSAVSSVTGSVTAEGPVRMIAHGEVLQIRLEIYSTTGDLVSDSGLRQGNIIDAINDNRVSLNLARLGQAQQQSNTKLH